MQGLIIDNFAGGGGASTGIEAALGRPIDVAINHDAEAVAMHAANHPQTHHLCQNVWKADPVAVVADASRRRGSTAPLPIELAWFSPDCKHFSKAKGSKPVEKGIRDLAWVVVHWARRVRPKVIMLENVEEFRDWGPLIETDDGRLVPCPVSKGLTFKRWCRELKKLGYKVEHRELRASDYKTPTIRKRLYVIARSDGKPIAWPEQTNAKGGTGGLPEWRWAAECIDFDLPCPSIFTRKKALAENTLRRIARGVMRYVVNAERPFIVSVAHGDSGGRREYGLDEPLGTVAAGGTSHAIVEPFLAGVGGRMGQSPERSTKTPMQTVTTKGDSVVVQPFIARIGQQNGNGKYANGIDEPVTTITTKAEHLLIAPHVTKFRNGSDGHLITDPLHTVTANSYIKRPGGAVPLGLVGAFLAPRYGERPLMFRCEACGETFKDKHATGASTLAPAECPRCGEEKRIAELPGQEPRALPVDGPMPAVVPTGNGGSLVGVFTAGAGGPSYGGKPVPIDRPMGTLTTENHRGVVAAFLAQHNTDMVGHDARSPVSTIVQKGCTQALVAAALSHNYTSNTAGGNGDPRTPAKTITTGGHHALLGCELSDEDRAGAERVHAFLIKYYTTGTTGQTLNEPLHTAKSKDCFGLVTVLGLPIVDIGMRMLTPRELFRAQGFPESYIIDHGPDGKPLTKTAQTRMCGNSVCPPVAEALVRANLVAAPADDLGERAAD